MKKLIYFIIPVFIGIIFTFSLNKFLDCQISKLYKSKNLTCLKNQYSSNTKDKALNLTNEFLEEGNIMMLGSSELSHDIKRQHPTSYFNTNRSKDGIFTIGRPFTQDLQDAIMVGSTNPYIKNKKVVLLLSMQWFMEKDGVTPEHFQDRFSPAQFYAFLENPKISNKYKMEMTKRVSALLKGSEEYKAEEEYATLYNKNGFLSNVEKVVLYPYFELRKKMVVLKDKGMLYRCLLKLPDKNKDLNKLGNPIDWQEEQKVALEAAKQRTKGNNLKIDTWYYNNVYKKNYKKLKDKYIDVKLMESKEVNDYEYFLDLCEDLEIKPTIVVIPASNWYYDYLGINEKERYKYYNKVTQMAKEKGFNVMNLKDKENVEYYLRDVMHLGTRGWLDVNERLYKEFDEEQVFNK